MTTSLPASSASDEPLPTAVTTEPPLEESTSPPDEPTLSQEAPAEAEPAPALSESPLVDLAAARQAVLDRIEQSHRLPPGMRSHLREALKDCPVTVHADEQMLPATTLLDALETWAPAVLGLDPDTLRRPAHPGGDRFFSGDPRQVSDEQAEQIARRQLERSGYLPATA